ncbi:MAG: ubiquinone biosynthesis accessory factor UbiJ [Burkholderiales bacterium]
MIDAAIVTVLNHLLAEAEWARPQLAAHTGKRARIASPFYAVALEVAHGGKFTLAQSESTPDVTIDVPPHAALTWLTNREGAWRAASVAGDTEFAATLSFLAANLRWDFEEDLSRLIGDIPAHRLGSLLRSVARLPKTAAASVARSLADYLTEEQRVLATSLETRNFIAAVDELRDAAQRLEKRVERMSSKLAQRPQR